MSSQSSSRDSDIRMVGQEYLEGLAQNHGPMEEEHVNLSGLNEEICSGLGDEQDKREQVIDEPEIVIPSDIEPAQPDPATLQMMQVH